jgi:hypothetical protein
MVLQVETAWGCGPSVSQGMGHKKRLEVGHFPAEGRAIFNKNTTNYLNKLCVY